MKSHVGWRSEVLNMIAAAIIALLVWAYANDRTREAATVSGSIRLGVSDPRAQYLEPVTPVPVSLEVRGSRRAIEQLEDALRGGMSLVAGARDVAGDPGAHIIDLAETIAGQPTVASLGVEIVRARPESVRYEVGTLVTEQVPITPVMPRTSVQGEIVVDPPVATVTLPETARRAIGALTLDAVVDTKNLEPGTPQQIDVDLRAPEALARWRDLYRVVPPRAKVSFTLLATTADLKLTAVPVRLALPPEAATWEISPALGDESVAEVLVTGPRSAIETLSSSAFQPAAIVDVRADQLVAGTATVPISFWRLPEGVKVLKAGRAAAGAMPTVQLRMLPKPR